MPALYSQARADLYNRALDLPPDTPMPTAEMLPHLADLLRVRICPGEWNPETFTAGQVRDYLAPTFGEARDIAVFREATLQRCLDDMDAGHKFTFQRQLCVEIVDFLHDLLPPQPAEGTYLTWDVVKALRPDFEELREEARRNSHAQLPKWQRWSLAKRGGSDDDPIPF